MKTWCVVDTCSSASASSAAVRALTCMCVYVCIYAYMCMVGPLWILARHILSRHLLWEHCPVCSFCMCVCVRVYGCYLLVRSCLLTCWESIWHACSCVCIRVYRWTVTNIFSSSFASRLLSEQSSVYMYLRMCMYVQNAFDMPVQTIDPGYIRCIRIIVTHLCMFRPFLSSYEHARMRTQTHVWSQAHVCLQSYWCPSSQTLCTFPLTYVDACINTYK